MKALVTGGGGFLGTYIVKELLKRNYEVVNLSRNSYVHLDELGVKTLCADLTSKEELEKFDLGYFDVIFHVAAMAGVWGKKEDFFNINYQGTLNLINKAKEDGVKSFIYTSTPSVVFEKEDIIAGDESLPYANHFLTFYAESKALAEKLVLEQQNISTIAIRPHLIWGPGDPHLFPRLIQKAKEGKLKQVGAGENLVDIIFVENAAIAHIDAFEALIKNPELGGSAYFIGQEDPVNLWEFVGQILNKAKVKPVEDMISFKKAYYVGAVLEFIFKLLGVNKPEPPMTRFIATQLAKSHYFSHAKAHRDFGYTPKVSTEDGLELIYKKSS